MARLVFMHSSWLFHASYSTNYTDEPHWSGKQADVILTEANPFDANPQAHSADKLTT